jgi:flagellar biosynthesis protein FlhA
LRRQEIAQESDFYGSMDGASKFVRGDATAGILILIINIIGGLAIGTLQHGLPLGEAAQVYTLLTIGDGLVAQIPSLLLSTSAAIMVTRVSTNTDMGEQIISQLFHNPKTLVVTGGMIGLIGLIPGMPNIAFLILAGLCCGGAWFAQRSRQQAEAANVEEEPLPEPQTEERELSWEDIEQVDTIGMEVGYRLIPLVDRNQGGQLLDRVKGVRKKLSRELGFLIPSIHIRDNLDLEPNSYRLTVMDATVAKAMVQIDNELAINPGHVMGELPGQMSKDPVFGLDAIWINPGDREHAQSLGYTVVDSSTVIATHLSQTLQDHAHELLGHHEIQEMLDRYEKQSPKVIQPGVLVQVMRNLLRENIPVRDTKTIIETIAQHAERTQDPETLTVLVRIALGRLIVERVAGQEDEVPVITLEGSLEQLLQQSIQVSGEGSVIEPRLAQRLIGSLQEAAERQEVAGQPTILLVPDNLRQMLSRFVRHHVPRLSVLSFSEIPEDKQLKIVATVGVDQDKPA